MMLAISTDSFHYKYYQMLRKMWNFEPKRDRTSLCIYTQFLFWFSVWTVLCSPAILGGWLLLKMGRFIYKVCSWTPAGRKVIDFLDELGLGSKIDKISATMVECPAATLTLTFFWFFIITALTIIVAGFLIGGLLYIKTIFMYILAFGMAISLAVFYICFGVGWILANIGASLLFGLKWIGIFLAGYGFFIIVGLVAIAASALFGMLVIKLVVASEKLCNFFGFRLNGYQKARSENAKRREELKEQERARRLKLKEEKEELDHKKAVGEIPYTLTERMINALGRGVVATIDWCGEFFVARTKNVAGGSVKVMSGFGVLWMTLKSLKHGVCPFVEFIEDDDVVEEESE